MDKVRPYVGASFQMMAPCFSSLHSKKMNIPVSKAFIRLDKKDDHQLINQDVRQVALSSHLVTENLQEPPIVQKQSQGASQKVDYIRTLLIDNYDSYTYNIYQELSVINGVPPVVVHNDEWTWKEAYHFLYEERAFDNIVISPGPGSPTCPSDIGLCLRVLMECSDIPILGICLGHQALAYVHGAKIVHAPEPIHGRLSEIEHNGCRLFHHIPSGSELKVVRYHSLVVDGNSLPKELIPVAWTSLSSTRSFLETSNLASDKVTRTKQQMDVSFLSTYMGGGSSLHANGLHNESVIMGLMHTHRPHFGLQFHPESVATNFGSQMFKNFRDITVDYLFSSKSSITKHQTACSQVPSSSWSQWCPRVVNNEFNCNFSTGKLDSSKTGIVVQNLKLRWRKLDCLANRVGGAERIFCKLFGACDAKETFWLDSSSTEKGRARFSFMGGRGGSLWKQLTYKLSKQSDNDVLRKSGGHLSIHDAQGSSKSLYLEDGFLDFMSKELLSVHCNDEDYEGLPFDFCGGYVGYIGYNLKVECGAACNHHNSSTPDACFFFADNFLAIDHSCGDVYIVSLHEKNCIPTSWLDDTGNKLLSMTAAQTKNVTNKKSTLAYSSTLKDGFQFEKSREQYMKDVEKCLGYIKNGESYELCLTTQKKKIIYNLDHLGIYLRLREQNPAPYAAWLNFSKEKLSICCSSPERFLRLDQTGNLEAKPIKGTISRGSTREEDEELKSQLQYSEKDQSENLMIVDLLRNDLGRVCEPGTVKVSSLMDVESYATVHTMVSTIRGTKRTDMSPVDCVRAAFPGGSMTGAPKLRSMEILDSLESCSRGIYSGSIGFFSVNKTFDLNIVIRTVVIHDGEASIGAGGAIVALSTPEDEYDEMILKTGAPTNAIICRLSDSQLD